MWLTMMVLTSAASMPIAFNPSPTGLIALALLAHGRVEAGIEDDGAGASDNGPNVEIERLQHVVGVAADEVFRCLAIMMPVANGIDFVDVVAHWSSPSGMRAARG